MATATIFAGKRLGWVLPLYIVLAVGCGSTTQVGEAPNAQPSAAVSSAPNRPPIEQVARGGRKTPDTQPAVPPVTGTTPTGPLAEQVTQPTARRIAEPTSEQIKRWTPAPFEPLQLLAIREWEKTSFTGQLAPTRDGKHFIVAGSRVLLWSVAEEQPEHVFLELTPADQDRTIHSLDIAPDGTWFAAGDSTGMVRIWNLENRQELVVKRLGSTGIQGLTISPDAREIATNSYDNEVTISTADTLEQLNKFKVDTNGLNRIEYMAPQLLAAAGETTSLWNTGTGKLIQLLSPGRFSFALGRSPDGSQFIFGGDDSLHIWNVTESRQVAEISQSVSGSESLAFSSDGKFLATTNGRSVQIWNLAERRVVQVIDSFGWPIVALSWLPETNLLVVASDVGCNRIWGTPSQGATLGLKPLHNPVAMPDVASRAPATQVELKQMIDLRIFPRLPGSEPTMMGQGDFSCLTTATPEEARTFYAYFLQQQGWTAADASPANPVATEFRKNGFKISLHCYDAGDGKTNVMLHHDGNYDLRWAPKFDAGTVHSLYEADNTVSYRTKADLLQIETALLRKFHAAGWTPYVRLNSSHGEQPDQRDLNFLRNGTTLLVSIGRFPTDPESYTIQYSLFFNNSAVPIPPDSGFVEFDGSTDPSLVATTALTLKQASEFYDSQMATQGWLNRKLGRAFKDDHAWLSYVRNQNDLTVGLTKLPDGRTLVRVGNAVGSLWELAQATKQPAGEANAVGADAAEGLEAADFPVANATQSAKFDADGKSIEIQLEDTTLASAAERFSESLKALGWALDDGGIRAEDYTMLTYGKAGKEITLRARLQNGKAVVNFQGDGLLWNKELPTGKQIVSYESWLRQNRYPAGLERLDEYAAAMRAIHAPATPAQNK